MDEKEEKINSEENVKNESKNQTDPKIKKEKTPEEANKEIATIMPTMIDDSEEEMFKKRDLSAIIPQFQIDASNDAMELNSKDTTLKTDGSQILATIEQSGETLLRSNFAYPEQIDIEARREEQIRSKTSRKKKEKKKASKSAQKQQNIMSIAALVIIVFLVAFYFLVYKAPTEKDFTPKTVRIELGDKLPIRVSSFVSPGVGSEDDINEMNYTIDKSKIKLEEVGEYEFTVTYMGVTKSGLVIIEDTTKPILEVRNVTVTEGHKFTASSFVEMCRDYSGCNYSFQDSDTEKAYTTPGSYVVYVVATDAYQNSVTKKANLIIEAEGNVKIYQKETDFDFNTGYSTKEEYELHFSEYAGVSTLISGTYIQTFKYEDELKYNEARSTYNGEVNYKCNDHDKTIVHTKIVNVIGSNYSNLDDIHTYLTREGYKLGDN